MLSRLFRTGSKSLAVFACALGFMFTAAPAAEAQEYFDDTNGVWTLTTTGQQGSEQALTECYSPGGSEVTLRVKDKVSQLKKTGDTLTGAGAGGNGVIGGLNGNNVTNPGDVNLKIKGLATKTPADDTMEGTYYGKSVVFKRDVRSRAPIVLKLPGDRPWVRFMREVLIPKTAEDRETYHAFTTAPATRFLTACQLYVSDYWMRKYMKGGGTPAGRESFANIIRDMNGLEISPRSISNSPFGTILRRNMAPTAMDSYALARSGLGMYFSTAAGGSVRIEVTDNKDCVIYYITDRRANSKNGLVVMATPSHAPLASSFGKWLLDFSDMDKADDMAFAKSLLETMVKSSTKSANSIVSAHGRSAFTDYLGVMAIEDQRGVMFANDDLSWGYNMTSGSFTALISRALSHGQKRPGPNLVQLLGDTPKNRKMAQQMGFDGREELASQVIVDGDDGYELRPGNAAYFDVMNGADDVLAGEGTAGGNDFQESGGMEPLSRLTTKWLEAKHPALCTELKASLAMFIPEAELGYRSKEDLFHRLVENFFDAARFSKVTPAQGDRIIKAALALVAKINEQSRDLEAFILANDVTKSEKWAPRASGF